MAAAERVEEAGSRRYHDDHMGAIFQEGFSFSGYERDLFVWNRGDGTFTDLSGVCGMDSISDGRGAAYADFDNDGDTDVFLTSVQGKAHYLFRNNVGDDRHFLRLELIGTTSGRDAFGTVVRIESATAGRQAKFKAGGGGYVSQSDGRLLFGLGDDTAVERLEIVWPDGARQTFTDLPADRTLRFVEGRNAYESVSFPVGGLPEPWSESERLLAHTGLRIGAPMPSVPLRSVGGLDTSLARLGRPGRRTLVNLWATWCVSCVDEIPELIAARPALAEAGVELVGISADVETLEDVPGYVEEMGIDYPVATTDERGMAVLFPSGETTVPLTILLDTRGHVERAWVGWNETVREELLAALM